LSQLDVLWQLQALDLQLDLGQKQLQEAQGRLGESDELRLARQAAQETADSLKQRQRELRDVEMELASLQEKLDDITDRLYSGRVTNPKELASMQQNQQHLQKRRGELDDVALRAMTEIDDLQSALAERQAHLEEVNARWVRDQQELKRAIGEFQAKMTLMMAQRTELASMLDRQTLRLYEELRRTKGGRAVSGLKDGLCQGCRMAVPTAKMQLVRRKTEIVFCGGCGRILYAE